MNRINRPLHLRALYTLLVFVLLSSFALLLFPRGAQAAILRQGSSGTLVKTVQTRLKNWGYYTGSVDGVYGPKTVAAVKKFQAKHGLTADGIVGPATASKLGVNLGSSSGSSSGSSAGTNSNDVYLLAKLVYGEGRGEPYTGQVAIAAVVLNRVKNPSFPNSIAGVIYQPGAFDVVSDGQINLSPDASALKAARDAMAGWDPTNGCIYYYNPRTATSKWILSRPIMLTIGAHVFCR